MLEDEAREEIQCHAKRSYFADAAVPPTVSFFPGNGYIHRRHFQHAHFIPTVGLGKRGEYQLVHSDLLGQHSFGTTLRFTGPVPADFRQ